MADEYRGAPRDHLQPAGQPANYVFLFPERRNQQQLCLDAGRALMICGALVVISTAFDAANTTLVAIVGFLLWILGACLCLLVLAFTPAAPWVVRAGAAVASTVLKCLCPPMAVNY